MRGSAFAFRKFAPTVAKARFFGAIFAMSSVLTPFFFGRVAGGGRVGAGARSTAAGIVGRRGPGRRRSSAACSPSSPARSSQRCSSLPRPPRRATEELAAACRRRGTGSRSGRRRRRRWPASCPLRRRRPDALRRLDRPGPAGRGPVGRSRRVALWVLWQRPATARSRGRRGRASPRWWRAGASASTRGSSSTPHRSTTPPALGPRCGRSSCVFGLAARDRAAVTRLPVLAHPASGLGRRGASTPAPAPLERGLDDLEAPGQDRHHVEAQLARPACRSSSRYARREHPQPALLRDA